MKLFDLNTLLYIAVIVIGVNEMLLEKMNVYYMENTNKLAGHRTIEMLGLVLPKFLPISNYKQQAPTLLWLHAHGHNVLGPTMLHVVGQQCCKNQSMQNISRLNITNSVVSFFILELLCSLVLS